MFTAGSQTGPVKCGNVSVVNDTVLTCTLPATAAPPMFRTVYSARLQLSSTYMSADSTYLTLYDAPNAVRIGAVNCTGGQPSANNAFTVQSCSPGGLLSLSLYWLDGAVPTSLADSDFLITELVSAYTVVLEWRNEFECTSPQLSLHNATEDGATSTVMLTCQLPSAGQLAMLAGVQDVITFVLRQLTASGTLYYSNAVYVDVSPPALSSSSSSSAAPIATSTSSSLPTSFSSSSISASGAADVDHNSSSARRTLLIALPVVLGSLALFGLAALALTVAEAAGVEVRRLHQFASAT